MRKTIGRSRSSRPARRPVRVVRRRHALRDHRAMKRRVVETTGRTSSAGHGRSAASR